MYAAHLTSFGRNHRLADDLCKGGKRETNKKQVSNRGMVAEKCLSCCIRCILKVKKKEKTIQKNNKFLLSCFSFWNNDIIFFWKEKNKGSKMKIKMRLLGWMGFKDKENIGICRWMYWVWCGESSGWNMRRSGQEEKGRWSWIFYVLRKREKLCEWQVSGVPSSKTIQHQGLETLWKTLLVSWKLLVQLLNKFWIPSTVGILSCSIPY